MADITLVPSQDVYVSEWYDDSNFSTSTGLFVSQYKQPGDDYRSLLQFDLAAIPSTCTIEKAELELMIYRNEVAGGILVQAHRLLNNWDETTVSWDNQPPFDPEADGAKFISQSTSLDFICIDISDLVRGWYDGSIPNQGLILTGDEALNDLVGFISTRGCFSNEWPRLHITFRVGILECFEPQEITVPRDGCDFIESEAIPLGPREKATFMVVNASQSHHVKAILQVGFSCDPHELFFNVGNWHHLEPSGYPGEAVALTADEAAEYVRVLIEGRGGETVFVFPRTKEL